MIKVDRIRVVEFRGIRDLTIDLNGANFAVCGPNGTGKSGVVDALEFGLSGTISRLTGKGQGSVSVKDHGPHVNSRNHPEKAVVTIDVTIPSLGGKKATITRNVKSPRAPTIAPADADVLAVFEEVQQHPEFCLSRREIIKYVLAEPGVRATEVQALLQLDKLDTARGLLVKIFNAATRELKPLDSLKTSTAENLMRALGIAEIKASALLEAVNAKRAGRVIAVVPTDVPGGVERATKLILQPDAVGAMQPNSASMAELEMVSVSASEDMSEDVFGRTLLVHKQLSQGARSLSQVVVSERSLLRHAYVLRSTRIGMECPSRRAVQSSPRLRWKSHPGTQQFA